MSLWFGYCSIVVRLLLNCDLVNVQILEEIPMSREVVVVEGARTAVGTFGGSLKDFAPRS
jgi:hypothetical protein